MKMKTKWVEEVDNFRLGGKSMDKVIIINHGVNYYKIDEICGRMVCCKAVEDSVLDVNLYSYIQSCVEAGIPFSVCNLNEEEFKLLENEIKRYGSLDRLTSARSCRNSYVPCRFMITRGSDDSEILFADYDNPKKRGEYSFDYKTETLNYFENRLQFTGYYIPIIIQNGYTNGFKIYTPETYEDVIKHYQEITDKKQSSDVRQKTIEKQQ